MAPHATSPLNGTIEVSDTSKIEEPSDWPLKSEIREEDKHFSSFTQDNSFISEAKLPYSLQLHADLQPEEKVAPPLRTVFPPLEIEEHAIDEVRSLRVVVVGAGIAGITAGILLPAKVPGLDLSIYEKASDVVCAVFFVGLPIQFSNSRRNSSIFITSNLTV